MKPSGSQRAVLHHNPSSKTHHIRKLVLVLGLLGLLVGAPQAWATGWQWVELCYAPPWNPDNARTVRVGPIVARILIARGATEGPCPVNAADIDPPEVMVDDTLVPTVQTIEGIDGGPPRPLARLGSDTGNEFDFVANEVYLITEDDEELAEFQSRWPSELLQTTELPSSDPAQPPTRMHLLTVDASSASMVFLNRNLARLSPELHGIHSISSESARRLLALVASERRLYDTRIGINPLLVSADFFDRETTDAMDGDDVPTTSPEFVFDTNAFRWPYMDRDPRVSGTIFWPNDTGAADANRVVEAAGMLDNRVRVMIMDGGFFPNQDFPDFTMEGPLRTVNPDPTGCGSGTPPTLSDDCGTHGTHVLMAGFARPDNAFGGFGPGGAVGEMILVQAPAIDIGSLVNFIFESLPSASGARPQIVNISASVSVDGGWCFIACEPLDELSKWFRDNNIIFVAAAGNTGKDVDAVDDICLFDDCTEFETQAIIPCELDDVICVGATNFLNASRTDYSNYGSVDDDNSVDIFAPGNVYSVDAIQADSTVGFSDDLMLVRGTSYAAPFAAGVFALTWAANPSLSVDEVIDCVLDTAHTESPTGDRRRINALGAVSCAMGETHPWVSIQSPEEGRRIRRGFDTLQLVANSDDYEDVRDTGFAPIISWQSSGPGDLGTTVSEGRRIIDTTDFPLGNQIICAEVTDASSRWWADCVQIEVENSRPTLEIVEPGAPRVFSEGSTINLVALVDDPDGPPPTVEWRTAFNNVAWEEQSPVAFGADTTYELPLWMVSGRDYVFEVRATDIDGAFAAARFRIDVSPSIIGDRPVITVDEPTDGQSFESTDAGPVTITLVASAEDAEDGPMDFEEIDWFYAELGDLSGFPDPLAVSRQCLVFQPGNSSVCTIWGPWTFELAPDGSNTLTQYEITGFIRDSDGNVGRVIFVIDITQPLI